MRKGATADEGLDDELMARAVADPSAFGVVFDRFAPTVFSYLAATLGREQAQVSTVEVFAIAFRRRADYVPRHPTPLPWLLGIARNEAHRHLRSEGRRRRIERRAPVDRPEGSEAAADARVDADRLAAPLRAALLALDDGQREVLLLTAYAGLGYREIADHLGIPIGTVRSRLSRARSEMQRRLAPLIEPGSEPRSILPDQASDDLPEES